MEKHRPNVFINFYRIFLLNDVECNHFYVKNDLIIWISDKVPLYPSSSHD